MEIPASPPTHDPRSVQPRLPNQPRILSIGQQRLWYIAQLAPESGVYNVPFSIRMRGTIDVSTLEQALQDVIERHEVLRTVILAPGGKPVPVLLKKWQNCLQSIDLRSLPESQREERSRQILYEEAVKPFNLARDLMFRCVLIRLADGEYIFLHLAPHIVFEGGSISVLYRDLSRFYASRLTGVPPDLPKMRIQYADFALWQQELLQGETLDTLLSYWKEQLAGAPPARLPIDYPRPAIHTGRGKRINFRIPADLLAATHLCFRECGTTRYRGFTAIFKVFLSIYTGQTDLSIGSPFLPRCSGLEDLIGFFVNTTVLRTRFSPGDSFRQLAGKVNEVVLGAIKNSDLTFDRLVDAVRPPRDQSRGPLFQVNFRAPAEPYPILELSGVTSERPQYLDNGTSKFDLALEIESSRAEACYFEYCEDLWKKETIQQMILDLQLLLRGLCAHPDTPLDQVREIVEIRSRIKPAGATALC
jgi:hypothetical protein